MKSEKQSAAYCSSTLKAVSSGATLLYLLLIGLFLSYPMAAQTATELRRQALRFLLEARETAREMKDEEKKASSTLANIASGLVLAGDLTAGLETLALFPEQSQRDIAKLPIAWDLANARNWPGALRLVNSIRDPQSRASALLHAAGALIQRKDFDAALSILPQLDDNPWNRLEFVLRLARAQAEAADLKGALEALREGSRFASEIASRGELEPQKGGELASRVLLLQREQMRLGDAAGAADSAALVDMLIERGKELDQNSGWRNHLAGAYSEIGEFESAIELASALPQNNERDTAFSLIAQRQAQRNNRAGALETLQLIRDDAAREWALINIATALAEKGDAVRTMEMAARIQNSEQRGYAFVLSAWLLALRDQHASALLALERAHEASPETYSDSAVSKNIDLYAQTLALAGNPKGGWRVAQSAKDEGERAEAVGRVAHVHACNEGWQAPYAMALRESSPHVRAEALLGIGRGLLDRADAIEKDEAAKAQ